MVDNRKNPYPWMLIGGGVLLILAGLVWVVLNQPPVPIKTPTPDSVEQVKRVLLEDAKAAYDAGTAVFLDVRDSGSYNVSHIPGALFIPVSDLTNRLSELKPSSWIITYCT
jgi:3-mercaptopyruvate sulfurtransferase SseA